ncbi:uncharacterized protein LOC113231362 isoform X2 [Hyposmocoma kahamanoa]|uniref:uncharacterized protein LOC113231362 isoform X2 n=1 Tax=Hyposmocoma kahamanoa TaxID=1477025 RepID=UPI000E6D8A2F|nr:uncharacterized protein LOC113231362 isoform X2 [Hyposmocoma kahamanoa]
MIVFAVILICFVSTVAPESCYYQRCISCHPQETDIFKGTIKECHPSNWVSAEWLHELGHPPPSTDSKMVTQLTS